LQARLHRVRLLAMGVDGVLTDAGMRIKLLQAAGLVTAFVTKEKTAIVERRGQKLEVPEVHRAAKVRCPDIRLARELLGWEPKVRLDEGLRRTIEYFRKKLEGRGS